jgi:hypothetical protein
MLTTTTREAMSPWRNARELLKGTAAVLGLVLACVGPAQGLEIVQNGSFETEDFSSWTPVGDPSFSGVACPFPAPHGQCVAFFGPPTPGGIEQTLSTIVDAFYYISFVLETDGGVPSSFSASFGGTNLLSLINPPAMPFETFSFQARATSASTLLTFTFTDPPGFIFLDSVSVVLPEPGNLPLLALALAMLIGMRRRQTR